MYIAMYDYRNCNEFFLTFVYLMFQLNIDDLLKRLAELEKKTVSFIKLKSKYIHTTLIFKKQCHIAQLT